MFYSSLLFHKEVNFTLKNYFNQLFSLLSNPTSNSTISTEINLFERIPDHQEDMNGKLSWAKPVTHPQGGESKQRACWMGAFGLDMHPPII
jgi:hypothetical protein